MHAVVARPEADLTADGNVPGRIDIGRGGMVCNTLSVAASLGAHAAGIIASGDDAAGALMRKIVDDAGIAAAHVITRRTPTTVTIATGALRASVMGVEGEREADLDPDRVEEAWGRLGVAPAWALLTLPALDSPAGQRFVQLAQQAGSRIAVTLSSARHVAERATRLTELLSHAALVVGNADETAQLTANGTPPALLITTSGAAGATIHHAGQSATVPAAPADVVDATGAGDAFAAGLLAALDPKDAAPPAGLDAIERAVRAGHRAAAVVVGLLGAEPGAAGRKRLAELGAEVGLG